MGGKNVKNTIFEGLLQLIAPHPCYSCGENGPILCHYCKFNIINEPFLGCIFCGTSTKVGICLKHQTKLSRVFVTGLRQDGLKTLIDVLKFHNAKGVAAVLADILNETAPQYPANTCVVPIPTISSHIRQRGYDHIDLIAKQFATKRHLKYDPCILRQTNTVQRTAKNKIEREKQAQEAFALSKNALHNNSAPILLIDDIVTTGSTLTSAAHLFSEQNPVYAAVLAYQSLD